MDNLSNTDLSKLEKIVIISFLVILTCLLFSLLFIKTEPVVLSNDSAYENSVKELRYENEKLHNLIDSLEVVDSLHLVELQNAKVKIKVKKDEITKIIKFIPDADTKFRDSLWTDYFKN